MADCDAFMRCFGALECNQKCFEPAPPRRVRTDGLASRPVESSFVTGLARLLRDAAKRRGAPLVRRRVATAGCYNKLRGWSSRGSVNRASTGWSAAHSADSRRNGDGSRVTGDSPPALVGQCSGLSGGIADQVSDRCKTIIHPAVCSSPFLRQTIHEKYRLPRRSRF